MRQGLARLKVWVRRMSRQIRNVHTNDVVSLLGCCIASSQECKTLLVLVAHPCSWRS